ncbi:DUF4249 domain-containing protein [Kordia algicida OT-1]|uniref:DUF4249 domain-containing protein n=1 Tax=Kordia algicida OT-1 TaxID=391587 RepID=A9DRU0_9FLAO|nr:DUF4249 domain-containing protein [Kordia algicida]EDP96842.1 hypothetical protein KAOT1_16803 [Kordia algicida OT-1]
MTKNIKFTVFLALIITFISCDDKIDVDVPEAPPRLVIEASLDWKKGTAGNNQTIKLSTSTPFFDTTTNTSVIGASVRVTNNNSNAVYNFVDQNDGNYTITNFVPVLNDSYTLEVIYNGETYTATENLIPVTPIMNPTQSLEGGFDDEVLDVTIFFDDPADEENFYMVRIKEDTDLFAELETQSDEFTNGNVQEEFFEKERDDEDPEAEYNPGDTVNIRLFGISERYYNFISLLIEQYDSGGDPFSVTPAEIRGNCVNQTNEANYAFGYFRVTEFDEIDFTFQ